MFSHSTAEGEGPFFFCGPGELDNPRGRASKVTITDSQV